MAVSEQPDQVREGALAFALVAHDRHKSGVEGNIDLDRGARIVIWEDLNCDSVNVMYGVRPGRLDLWWGVSNEDTGLIFVVGVTKTLKGRNGTDPGHALADPVWEVSA